ncbi:hypothetical protein [Flavilitoribacter nigricans]|uniref:Uncharacterized protein n=1 Tax=Flavilitoribacter nigricans (strain ATCC 23147 / DSM 23189 / NBRC 102662 / NCIMB 1420 / SS-2) TaxID=1122177 RepID=A0A2D0MXC7_FLAN2|nr:hypothetical protein [Flavilitoribacter nigricans]PHN00857.1 hypothetical protein CRP01_40185 [Flavilitoribacter nigricans DSM 23189 = NBRC 102662]
MKTHSQITTHLNDHAQQYVRSKGFSFGSGAAQDMQGMLDTGANNILHPTPEFEGISQDELIGMADKKLEVFIDHMVAAREKVYPDPSAHDRVGEETYAWAKNRLCPMWPFCT